MDSLLRIGELAAETGVTTKTIRFYEAAGVLPAPVRSGNGYRLYQREAAALLRFIKQARGLDLTLAEIKELVAMRRRGEVPCPHVYQLLREKAEDLERRLKAVTALRRELRRSARRAPPGLKGSAVCPHIEARTSGGPPRRHSERGRGARAPIGKNLRGTSTRLDH